MNRPAASSRGLLATWVAAAALLLGGCAALPASGPEAPATAAGTVAAPAPTPASTLATPAEATAEAARSLAVASTRESSAATTATAATPSASPAARPAAPRALLDPEVDAARGDLWQRVRDGLAMPDLDSDPVRKWEQWYAARPDYVARMMERGERYLFHIVEEVSRRGLPSELALLPFIESAFNPEALSRARAAGMWQFMPATGKDFELRQNLFRDDRRDVLASTRAALDYLERLHARFGDWHLALAAYNWGQGNVQRAVDRQRGLGQPADYASLPRLPVETREYVPKLQAVKNIVRQPEAFGLTLPAIENHPYFLSVPIERDIDVALAARLAGLSVEAFRQLNPQHHKPVILAAGTPQVLLPYESANRFVRELAEHRGALATWTAWQAPRTLRPAEAARLVGMKEDHLREVNRIPPRMLVKVGSTLLVPRGARATDDVPEHVADTAAIVLAPEAPPLRRVVFRAGRHGDSVAAVAKRYRVSAAQVAQWNGVGSRDRFAAGRPVIVMLPAPATRSTRSTRVLAGGGRAVERSTARSTPRPASRAAAPRRADAKTPVRVAQR